MMHKPMHKADGQYDKGGPDKTLKDYIERIKTFEEWIVSPFFEFGGKVMTRKEWYTASEIQAAKEAWKVARGEK